MKPTYIPYSPVINQLHMQTVALEALLLTEKWEIIWATWTRETVY